MLSRNTPKNMANRKNQNNGKKTNNNKIQTRRNAKNPFNTSK